MHVAKTGLNAQQTRMQVIANNLSNVNTSGFKRDRANFESLLYQIKRASRARKPKPRIVREKKFPFSWR